MIFILFPAIYILANIIISLMIRSFIRKRLASDLLAWSYSISISLGITFILSVLFIAIFAKDLLKFY